MSSGFSIKLQRDDVTKDLQRLMGKVKNATPLLRAIGVGLVGVTKSTFNDASLRPLAWAPKKDGSKATLKSREATLWRSIRVQSVGTRNVVIGSDRPYAAIHQLGGKTRPMPQRPYFPVHNGQITQAGQTCMADVIEAYLKVRGTRK